jgi:hypothetical protein
MSKRARIIKPLAADPSVQQRFTFRVREDEITAFVEGSGVTQALVLRAKHGRLVILPQTANMVDVLVGKI